MIRGYRGPQRQPINQPRIGNLLDPLGDARKWTNVWGAVMNVPQPSGGAPVSPTPTNTSTPTPTPSITPTLTPTPTDARACRTYRLDASFDCVATFNWTNCDGTPGNVSLCLEETTICAKQGSVSNNIGTIIDIGTCPLPSPTPTPSITPTITPTLTPTQTATNTPTPSITPTSGVYSGLIATGATQNIVCSASKTILVYSEQPILTQSWSGNYYMYTDNALTNPISYNGYIGSTNNLYTYYDTTYGVYYPQSCS